MGGFGPTENRPRLACPAIACAGITAAPLFGSRCKKNGPSRPRPYPDPPPVSPSPALVLPRASRWRIKLRSIRSLVRKPQQSATIESEVAASSSTRTRRAVSTRTSTILLAGLFQCS
jgi:hypothetical protein